jgi:hypothetical protein
MKFTDALKKTVATVAPMIGTALGGPLGGTAGRMLAQALGKEGASEDEIEQAVLTADPDTLLKVKQAELDFQKFLKEADIKIVDLDNQDRANARMREMGLRDWTPSVLSAVVTVGFFGVLIWMLAYGLPESGQDALLVMLGSLGTAWAGIIAYYFGSSAGSRNKQVTIDTVLSKR